LLSQDNRFASAGLGVKPGRRGTMLTEDELRRIEQRVAVASPGPWEWNENDSPRALKRIVGEDELDELAEYYGDNDIIDSTGGVYFGGRDEDESFIAHAREDVPALLMMIRQLQAQVSNLQTWQWRVRFRFESPLLYRESMVAGERVPQQWYHDLAEQIGSES